jgi:hypothetical protein
VKDQDKINLLRAAVVCLLGIFGKDEIEEHDMNKAEHNPEDCPVCFGQTVLTATREGTEEETHGPANSSQK